MVTPSDWFIIAYGLVLVEVPQLPSSSDTPIATDERLMTRLMGLSHIIRDCCKSSGVLLYSSLSKSVAGFPINKQVANFLSALVD